MQKKMKKKIFFQIYEENKIFSQNCILDCDKNTNSIYKFYIF